MKKRIAGAHRVERPPANSRRVVEKSHQISRRNHPYLFPMKLVVHHIPLGQDEATPDRSINRRSEGRTASIDSLPRDYWGEDRQGDHIDLWNGSRLTHLRFIALENLARWCCQAGVRRALDQHLVQWCLPVTPSKWNPVTPLRAKLDGEAGISATRLWALTKRFNRSKRYDRPRPATEFPLRVASRSTPARSRCRRPACRAAP